MTSLPKNRPSRKLTGKLPTLLDAILIKIWGVSLFFLLLAATGTAHAYPVNQCPADRFGEDLNCTANDVSITGMRVVGDATACVGGTNISLDLEMTINFATPDRWDIGVFIANDGKNPQLRAANGGAATCSVGVLPTASPFLNLDNDSCGDGNGTIGGGTGRGIHYMTNVTVPCQSLAGAEGKLYIPFVVSWDNQASPSGATCTSNADPVPNTKSKCNAPTITQGTVEVLVLPSISKTDGKDTLFSGDSTTYTVTITNTTGVSLSGAVFKDPAVSGIAVSGVSCSAAGGAICPISNTVATMQSDGIPIPDMPAGGSVTFTIPATLTGTPPSTLTNTAYVTVGSQTNTASDSNMIVDSIAITPPTQTKTGDKNATVTYIYTVHNYGISTDAVNLSLVSSRGWAVERSPTSLTLAPGASSTVTVTVAIPGNAAVGTVDTTTLTGLSSATGKTATATAITTVTDLLTLVPNNTSAGGAGTYVYYSHRVQNNASSSKTVSLTPTFPAGTCIGWTSTLYETDKTTSLASPVTLAASGGYKDFILRVQIPSGTAAGTTCTTTLTAAYTSGASNAVSVIDITTVKNLLLYEDPGYTTEQYTYPAGNAVYGKSYGLTNGQPYYYRWLDSTDTVRRTSPVTNNLISLPDTYEIPIAGPLGTWTVQICNNATTAVPCTVFTQTNFYVGPDHLQASYSGADPTVNTNMLINLALHDKSNHAVPFDASGNLVRGNPSDPEGPLMITVTVSGSAEIIDDPVLTTLGNYSINGQTITGYLSSTTGTAQIVIRSPGTGEVTVTPASYKGVLYGSPVRDHPATLNFKIGGPGHYELSLPTAGITCLPTTVTVTACADNSSPCTNPLTTVGGQTATLATSAGTLASATVTFNALGVASTTLSYPAAANGAAATVTLSSESTAPATPRKCCPDGTDCAVANSCSTTFNTAGFIFSPSPGGGVATIPPQVAGVPSSTYYLRAVKTDTITKACETALTGTSAVDFAYECNDPATCYAADLMSVNGGSAATIARNNNGSVSSYTSLNLNFDANGNAPFIFNYGDAGKVTLHARKTVNSALLTGSSNAFVVKPYDFGVIPCAASVVGNCTIAPSDPGVLGGGSVFAKAGEAFKATVTARTATGTATPSFGSGSNNATEGVALTHTRVAPTDAGTADGTLAGTTPMPRSSFSNGIATISDLSWSEVGVITLTAINNAFLGNALTTTGTTGNLGRFIPHHFAIEAGGVTEGCDPGNFTYFGQDGFVTAFTLTAQNEANTPTRNYIGAFAKLDLSNWNNYNFTAAGLPIAPTLSILAASSATAPSGSWTNGVASVSAKHQASRPAAPVAPADITVSARPADPDGVTMASAVAVQTATTQLRYGRLVLQNAFGPETEDHKLPFQTQYFDNTAQWVTNTEDSCTTLVAANFSFSNYLQQLASNEMGSSHINASLSILTTNMGKGSLFLTKPSGGDHDYLGSVDVCADLGPDTPPVCAAVSANMPWLQGNWTGADYDDDPKGRINFGIYRGNDRIINWREIIR
jgi:hypothetical protein